MKACDAKKGQVVELQGEPHLIEQIQVQTPSARGANTLYKIRFRNAKTRQKSDQTLKGEDQLTECDFEKNEVQYLYKSGDAYAFMNLEDYTQFEMTASDLEEHLPYLVDELEGITALLVGGRVIGMQLPDVVELEIVECDPSIKGASATSRTKPATLETGLTVQVPEYLASGERIRVDTRSGLYLSRA